MTNQEIKKLVAALDAIPAADPETAHSDADDLLIAAMPKAVQDAHARLVKRCGGWACA